MSQVDIYQYAEVIKSDGTKIKIGSKQKPSTITLTGTGEVSHRVFNDLEAGILHTLYDGELTGVKFFAVKSSVDGTLALNLNLSGEASVHVEGNVWQFFSDGHLGPGGAIPWTEEALTDIALYIPGAVTADVEFIATY